MSTFLQSFSMVKKSEDILFKSVYSPVFYYMYNNMMLLYSDIYVYSVYYMYRGDNYDKLYSRKNLCI